MALIKSDEIRSLLKPFDSWGNRISKTRHLYAPHFDMLTVDEFRECVVHSNGRIAEEFGCEPDEVIYLWKENRHECENFAGELVTFSNILWAKREGKTAQPSIFRIIAGDNGAVHAYNICFTDKGIYFADLMTGTSVWKNDNPNIIGFG